LLLAVENSIIQLVCACVKQLATGMPASSVRVFSNLQMLPCDRSSQYVKISRTFL
jgi:hypothetical protein